MVIFLDITFLRALFKVSLIQLSNFRERVLAELENQGFSVVEDVLSPEECQRYSNEFKSWVSQYKDHDRTYQSFESLIQSYRIGHFNASWAVRLKAKPVFAEIWGTEKLLSSVDGVAVSPPPDSMPGTTHCFIYTLLPGVSPHAKSYFIIKLGSLGHSLVFLYPKPRK